MRVRIYRPVKSAMQSGRGKTGFWMIEPILPGPRAPEPLMGWISADDTLNGLGQLTFPTREAAIAYAQQNKLDFVVQAEQRSSSFRLREYTDNFRYTRIENWTH